jgi:hypothetical protein
MKGERAGLGFRVKTGRAIAVALAGPPDAPRLVARREVSLVDPALPESKFPYHAALELSEAKGEAFLRRARKGVEAVAVRAVAELARELRGEGLTPCGVGLAVASDTDPATLGNPHMRAHASEGRFFREVVAAGADAAGLPWLVVLERNVLAEAAAAARKKPDALRDALAEFGRAAGKPWRADEKTAALSAWLALAAAKAK